MVAPRSSADNPNAMVAAHPGLYKLLGKDKDGPVSLGLAGPSQAGECLIVGPRMGSPANCRPRLEPGSK